MFFFFYILFFFFNDTATTEIYTLSLHDALPISPRARQQHRLATSGWRRWRLFGCRRRRGAAIRQRRLVRRAGQRFVAAAEHAGQDLQRSEHDQHDARAEQQRADPAAQPARRLGVEAGTARLVLLAALAAARSLGGAARGGDEVRLAAVRIGNDRRPCRAERRLGCSNAVGRRIAAPAA